MVKGILEMKENSQIVITISRQLGSGGAYMGQQLAKKIEYSLFGSRNH